MQALLDALNAGRASAPAGGIGILVALALVLAVRLVLRGDDKRLVRAPLVLLALALALIGFNAVLAPSFGDSPSQAMPLFALFLLLCSIGRSGFLLLVHAALDRRLVYPLPKIVQDIIQLAIYGAIALVTLRAAGVEPGSLLATSALLTAVIGLSLQDTLGNLFAGLAIQAQRPFEVGDWIQFDDKKEHIGRVVEINWRATRVVTLDHMEITVPNATLAKAPIRNYTKPTPIARRTVNMIVPASEPPGRVRELLLEPVASVPGVLKTPAPSVILGDFNERGVEYLVRFFISDFERREPIGAQVRERLWYALHRAGIEIPMPGRRVDFELSSEKREARRKTQALECARALSKVDFLRVLPESARQQLAEGVISRLYSRDEIIICQGDPGDELFIVQTGEVSVFLDRGDGEPVEVATLGAGKFFGEMSLMTGEPRRATVRAKTECQVLVVGKRAFQEILVAHEPLVRKITEVLAARDEMLGEHTSSQTSLASAAEHTARSQVLLTRIREFFSL